MAQMTKGTGLSRLPLPHIVADIFGAGVVFLLSLAFLRREQRLIEKLVATKDLSEKLIETLPGVFCIFDAEGNVRRWNRNFLATQRLRGSRPESLPRSRRGALK
jgi:hypothetical protein